MRIIDLGEIRSRYWLNKNGHFFEDISIDPKQETRTEMGLTNSLPLFVGYYQNMRSYSLNGYLMAEYDQPRLQNKRFFGSLHNSIRVKHPDKYKKVVVLIANFDKICDLADKGPVSLFTDLAIKSESTSLDSENRRSLLENIEKCIVKNERGSNELTCEIDIIDDGNDCLNFPYEIDALIVDNVDLESEINEKMQEVFGPKVASRFPIYVDPLPNG